MFNTRIKYMELQCLNNWSETKKAFDMLKDEYDEKIDNLREKLQDKQNETYEHHENMVKYIWKVLIQTHTI